LKLYLHSIRFYYNPDIPFHLKHISYFTLSLRFLPPRPERSCSAVCPRRYSVDTLSILYGYFSYPSCHRPCHTAPTALLLAISTALPAVLCIPSFLCHSLCPKRATKNH
jgi:hypothetical protein